MRSESELDTACQFNAYRFPASIYDPPPKSTLVNDSQSIRLGLYGRVSIAPACSAGQTFSNRYTVTGQSLMSACRDSATYVNATSAITIIINNMADFKALPDETTIKEAYDLEVFDISGDKVKFGSICENSEKAIVVFISMH